MVVSARASVDLARHESEEDRRQALERACERLDRAEQINVPLPSALFSERARYRAALGDMELASKDRTHAAAVAPTTGQDFTMQGTLLLANRDLAGAEAALMEAIRRDVSSFWAWYHLGHCHFEQGRYLEASGDFAACFVGGLEFPWVHFNRGLALARAGRLPDAKISYDHALELDPEFVLARVNRGLVELELNRLVEARADLENAIAEGCRDVGVLTALGESLARLGRREAAERVFEELMEKNPGDMKVIVARGMTRVRIDPVRASADFTTALHANPKDAMAHYGMARVLRSRDRLDAIEHLNAALESDPDLIDALQLRALERAHLGQPGALDDVMLLIRAPTPHRLYNAACALAVYADESQNPKPLTQAMELLEQALRAGFSALEAASDPDLHALRRRPGFAMLLARFEAPRKPSAQ
jgi:tetratricopeptide (TPR) repeat protein